jgi:hypothetical protein
MKEIQHCLLGIVEEETHDLEHVSASELGEVVDMIKDLSEAMYYSSIVAAMEEASPEEKIAHDKTHRMEDHMKLAAPEAK